MKKSEVEISYHQGTNGLPMVNVKHHARVDLDTIAAKHRDEFPDALFPAWLAANEHDTARDMHDFAWERACEDGWNLLSDDAGNIWPGRKVEVISAGRSGGWCVVKGLPPVETWDAIELGRWAQFCRYAAGTVSDIGYRMVDFLYHNPFRQYRKGINRTMRQCARDAGMVEV